MEQLKQRWQTIPTPIRKIVIFIAGTVVLIAGILMLALPGPGWATIFLALAIYATEFSFAHRLKIKLMDRFHQAAAEAKKRFGQKKSTK